MRTLIDFNLEYGLLCGLITVTATAGKFGGTFGAARWTGLSWRTSTSLGLLMNTRGLMELIVLNVGLQLRIISPTLFAMMVLMALATTMATTPLLQLLELSQPSTPVKEVEAA
jgi:Kef-type K+ transport system membrane component KefB